MADQASRPARIVRATKNADNPYFVMCRKPAQDANLSWAARGVLVYLLSKPDDWSVEPKDLQQGCGRDKVYTILKELESAGYLTRETTRNDKKQFASWEYQLHELPVKPLPEKPDTAKPLPAQPDTANPTLTYKREEQRTDLTEESSVAALPGNETKPEPQKATEAPERPAKPAKPSAYSNPLLFDALGGSIFGATDKADIKAVGGRVGTIRVALIDYELAKRKVPDLDDSAILDLVLRIRGFPGWYESTYPGLDLPQHPNSFMPKWIEYTKCGGKVVPKPGAPVPEKQMAVVNGKVVWT